MARNTKHARRAQRQQKHATLVLRLFVTARKQQANMVQSYIAEAYNTDANYFVNYQLVRLLADFDLYVANTSTL